MFRESKALHYLFLVALMFLAVMLAPPSANEVCAAIPGLRNAIDSTVFIDVERNYRGEEFDGGGTGFFVARDGLILTNYHVVGDWVELWVRDQPYMVELSVIAISVAVHPRTPQQVILPAAVIALDRERDLALIKVNFNSDNYLSFENSPEVSLLDEIIICGFPLGDALVLDDRGFASREGGYPEVSVNTGHVTSIRRDDDGEKVAIQTDAAITFGNSGGPMVKDGKPVGVVFAKIGGGTEIGFAIPASKVNQFLSLQKIKAKFWPSRITTTRVPIAVTIRTGPLCRSAAKGNIVLSGSDIPETSYDLVMEENRMTATLELPAVLPGKPSGEHYEVKIVLTNSAGNHIAGHRFLLRRDDGASKSDEKERVAFQVIHNELTLQEYATRQARSKAVENGTAHGTSGRKAKKNGETEAGDFVDKKAKVDPILLAEVRKLARSFYVKGEYETAKELYRQIIEVAPEDTIARDYYLLANDRLLIGEVTGKNDVASVSVAYNEREKQAVGSVTVTFAVVSPANSTAISYWIDGEPQTDMVLSKSDVETSWGNPEKSITFPPGKHVIKIELNSLDGEKTTFRFEEKFKMNSTWTLRITVPKDISPSAYLVQPRT